MRHLTLALLLTAGSLAARADVIYTFAAPTYSFSFTFPTLLATGVDYNPFGTVPFTVGGVTFRDSASGLNFFGFSTNVNGLTSIGNGQAISFQSQDPGMTILTDREVNALGVYTNLFVIFNTTSLPTIDTLVVSDTNAAVPEPSALFPAAAALLALGFRYRRMRRA